MTIENAYWLVAELIGLDRNIIFIYITHLHRDHYLGMEVNKQKYPDARVIAYKKVSSGIIEVYDFKIQYWGKTVPGHNGVNIKFSFEKNGLKIKSCWKVKQFRSSVLWPETVLTLRPYGSRPAGR
ncbi:hypothetical protein [Pantoea sp. B270]|uniref:hypothetical protein n=1 Tax=Pantoea sp. B270 TaxID=2836826 RepID=UPI0020B19526|nr:hypothetical protein [Pantoea sp. B270]